MKQFIPNLLSVIILFSSFQFSYAQKIDVYSRPLQKEPSREYDAIHYRIKLRLDEAAKAFWGENTITLSPFSDYFQTCSLHAGGYTVTSVKHEDSRSLEFQQTEDKLIIHFPQVYKYDDTITFTVLYHSRNSGETRGRSQGIRFVDETPDNPPIIMSGSARFWFPCYDYPHDKVTHEIIITVPHEYKVLSNGKLTSITEDKKNGTKTFHWSQNLPNCTHLAMFVAGPFEVLKDSLGELPVNYWVWKQDVENAMRSFHRTPEMIEFFSREYGFDYPWAKYDQITVPGGGGAELTSASRLGQTTIHDERAEQDFSSHGWLICHELAHQWWGDCVTFRDWSHTWISESFGTYSEVMWALYDSGEDAAAINLLGKKNRYLYEAHTRYMRPIVFNRWERSGQNFDRHTYQKGAVIVHLMRWILGETPFHKALSHFLHKHAYQSADTHDFITAIKEATGQNLDWFFEQWLLSPGHPVFDVSYTWDEKTKKLRWRIVQTQDTSQRIPIYKSPLMLGIITSAGKRSEKVWLEKKEEVFEFDCAQKPLMVRFDEGDHLLKEWTFKKTVEELLYQLNHDNVIGRMWTASQLSRFSDNPRVSTELIERAMEDPFWAVRRDVVYVLGGNRGVTQMDLDRGNIPWTRLNEAFEPGGFLNDELIDFFKQKAEDENSKVRAAALWGLGNLRKSSLVPFLKERFEKDDSYRAQAAALVALGKSGDHILTPFLEKAAQMKSPKNLEDRYQKGILQRAAEWALKEIKTGY
jgi:aminopeptidase N